MTSFWIGIGLGIPIGILMYAAGSAAGAYLKTRTMPTNDRIREGKP